MASESSDSQKQSAERDRLPFEPTRSRKATPKKSSTPATTAPARSSDSAKAPATLAATAIPDAVSRRMIRRMALFCGIPSFLGMATFFASYFVVVNDLFPLPNAAVVLVSMGCFGLGVVGLSYGVLSASWDEDAPGSRLGWAEFSTNLGRMTDAWRSTKKP